MQGIVTVGDYDGVVSQVHVASGHLVADVDEHAGRRCDCLSPQLPAWSVVSCRLCMCMLSSHLSVSLSK